MMLSSTPTVLPASFIPSEQHVIIGRGRVIKMHPGNQKFDRTISIIGPEYSAAPSKADKGLILTRLVDMVHEQAADAGFVRRDPSTGVWTLVEEALARQTAAQALRNALHHSYRSSKQFKSKRRIQQIAMEKQPSLSVRSAVMTSISQQAEQAPRCVSPSSENLPEDVPSGEMRDAFSILMARFTASINPADDPFEPCPLAPENDAWNVEPLPFALWIPFQPGDLYKLIVKW